MCCFNLIVGRLHKYIRRLMNDPNSDSVGNGVLIQIRTNNETFLGWWHIDSGRIRVRHWHERIGSEKDRGRILQSHLVEINKWLKRRCVVVMKSTIGSIKQRYFIEAFTLAAAYFNERSLSVRLFIRLHASVIAACFFNILSFRVCW